MPCKETQGLVVFCKAVNSQLCLKLLGNYETGLEASTAFSYMEVIMSLLKNVIERGARTEEVEE